MTQITLQDGKVVMRDGQVGTEEACCCGECECVPCEEGFVVDFTISGSWIGDFSRTVPFGADQFPINQGQVLSVPGPFPPWQGDTDRRGFSDLSCSGSGGVGGAFVLDIAAAEAFEVGSPQEISIVIFQVELSLFCGSEYELNPGEWFVDLKAHIATHVDNDYPFDDKDPYLDVEYNKVYGPTDCGNGPFPFVDSNLMDAVVCRYGFAANGPNVRDNTEPDPCPFRVTARLRRV